MDTPSSLSRDISPPRLSKRRKPSKSSEIEAVKRTTPSPHEILPTLAAVEAGKAKIEHHLTYFKKHLSAVSTTTAKEVPRLSIPQFSVLYERNDNDRGNHFVVHQHNHPRAGVHYDLRLQFSKSSSISFAIPKGLPGNPNSKSLGRMAIETRVHNYWNHLIESASKRTGSLLIWDTGTYTVLPRQVKHSNNPPSPQTTDDESEDNRYNVFTSSSKVEENHENAKLIDAFQSRYIRLRLNGTRLPKDYTVTLRLPSANIAHSDEKKHRRRRSKRRKTSLINANTDSEPEGTNQPGQQEEDIDTDSDEDLQTRINNAYPGSTNSIGSIHQRQWFMSLDRRSSGFVPGEDRKWLCNDGGRGFEPFFVRGREFERSVITGRLAAEVERDEGLEGFVGRGGWVGILN